jgi:hypothetical protein
LDGFTIPLISEEQAKDEPRERYQSIRDICNKLIYELNTHITEFSLPTNSLNKTCNYTNEKRISCFYNALDKKLKQTLNQYDQYFACKKKRLFSKLSPQNKVVQDYIEVLRSSFSSLFSARRAEIKQHISVGKTVYLYQAPNFREQLDSNETLQGLIKRSTTNLSQLVKCCEKELKKYEQLLAMNLLCTTYHSNEDRKNGIKGLHDFIGKNNNAASRGTLISNYVKKKNSCSSPKIDLSTSDANKSSTPISMKDNRTTFFNSLQKMSEWKQNNKEHNPISSC